MAKVAQPAPAPAPGPLNVGPMAKRKTPSELRGEQLRRTSLAELFGDSQSQSSNMASEGDNGVKKPDGFRNRKYTDTRLDELYPAKKSRLRMLNVKDNVKLTQEKQSTEELTSLKNHSAFASLAAKRLKISCSEKFADSVDVSRDGSTKAGQTGEKCSQSIFRSVTELSSSGDQSLGLAAVDMDKALKGLTAACEPVSNSSFNADSSGKSEHYFETFRSECVIPGKKPPLDFTLKTKMRLMCACAVSGLHRTLMSSTCNSSPQFVFQQGSAEYRSSSSQTPDSQICSPKSLHSWVYPQSTLPPAVISVLASSAGEGDFLKKRHLAWEESFRSLYYSLRKNICNIFYVSTSHFVVLFTSGNGSGSPKSFCNAYISQSTRNIRSLLREHDVCFSMPLCHSKMEEVATEHLVELSEMARQNLGQTRKSSPSNDVDNTTQSLLAFKGNKDVQGLYDFLLNYRSFSTLLSGIDVPVLYSPVPFTNAGLSAPEIRCVDMKKPDHTASSPKDASSDTLSSIIEIKGTCIPPWIISRICSIMSSEATSYEASFATEPRSIGLNVAIKIKGDEKSKSGAETVQESNSSNAFGMSEAVLTPCLSSGFLTGLKFKDDSYLASLSQA
ncbi:Protein downstream neighbor of son homolog [Linum grandiflorum]